MLAEKKSSVITKLQMYVQVSNPLLVVAVLVVELFVLLENIWQP